MRIKCDGAAIIITMSALLFCGCGHDSVVSSLSSRLEEENANDDHPATGGVNETPGGQDNPSDEEPSHPYQPGKDDPGIKPDPDDPIQDNICEVGNIRCFDGYLHICNGQSWKDGNQCEYGCQADESDCNACLNGEERCVEAQTFCCSEGRWIERDFCTYGCRTSEPVCSECSSGEQKCENNVASICIDGIWNTQDCNNGCSGNICSELNHNQPTRYITSASHPYSPITPYVLNRMKQIASKNTTAKNNVFMKVGDSHYAKAFDGKFMLCFSNATSAVVTLDSYSELQDIIYEFQSEFDSFNRDSLAAVGGTSTNYLFNSNKSYPLQSEINAIHPRFAFFDHGTNDMGNGSYTHNPMKYTYNGVEATAQGYSWSLQDYYRQVTKAMDMMENAGIIPIITNIVPRHDTPATINYLGNTPIPSTSDYPTHMVSAFNAVSRGNAEARQLPFFDANAVFKTLPNEGISNDNVHASSNGSPCNFKSDGLQYGVNVRNLGSITMLNHAWNALYRHNGGDDPITEGYSGSGSQSDPFIITSLPYSHVADTSKSQNREISVYSSCGTNKEYGPEYYYKLVLNTSKRLRMFALSATSAVDTDIHLLRSSIASNTCIKRSDIMIQGTLKAGTYYIAVDSYGSDASNAGKYLLGIVECDSDDKYCDPVL